MPDGASEPERSSGDRPSGLGLWISGARPRTLPAAGVPVVVGTAAAVASGFDLILWRSVAALVVALAIQVGTNYANDYSDGVRGTDDEHRVGPLRLVGSGLVAPKRVKVAAYLSFATGGAVGLTLAAAAGWELVILGSVSILAGWFYTGGPRPYGYLGLGEAFVFVFFGVVATVGSAYVQAEDMVSLAVAVSIPVGYIATALLVINNLRDIPTDTESGKRTLAVALGDRRTRSLYQLLVEVPPLLSGLIALQSGRPVLAVASGAVVVGVPALRAVRSGVVGVGLIPVLGQTAAYQLAYGLFLSVALVVS